MGVGEWMWTLMTFAPGLGEKAKRQGVPGGTCTLVDVEGGAAPPAADSVVVDCTGVKAAMPLSVIPPLVFV